MKMRVAPLLAHFSEGIYPATIDRLDPQHGMYGDYIQWNFNVMSRGKPVSVNGLTSTTFNPKSKFYKWASSVTGRQFKEEEEFDTDLLHGVPCRVYLIVKELDGGGSINQVERLLPAELPSDVVDDEQCPL